MEILLKSKTHQATIAIVVLMLFLGAMTWRLATIEGRVVHGDEAVQAMRMADLMVSGAHPFVPTDHHGPLLHYLSALQHRLVGISSPTQLTEYSIRFLPWLATLLLAGVPFLLRPLCGTSAFPFLLLAVASPCVFFFSAYFIQEPLLAVLSVYAVTMTLRQLGGVSRPGEIYILAGILGLTLCLKMTALLLLATMGIGVLLVGGWRGWTIPAPGRIFGIAAAFLLPILLVYSAFLTRPMALLELPIALVDGTHRAATGAHHDHPPSFFLQRLLWYRMGGAPVWSEWPIVVPALASLGLVLASWRERPRWQRFLAIQPVMLTLLYVLIPYKTPWLLLSPIMLLALSAILPGAILAHHGRTAFMAVLLLLPLTQWNTLQHTVGRFSTDPRNPWVYSHSLPMAYSEGVKINEIAIVAEQHGGLVGVFGTDYWPYPWFLRERTNVGYWIDIPDVPLDVIIAPYTDWEDVSARLKGDYHFEYIPMRPEVPLVLFVRREIWQAWLEEYRR
ncbi:MAG: hypothetical protein JJU11_00985 [Candidatus Sumerlaeia bacterium]|nr:hypothetical protein [Candidatus Sumerlaeia bacterium]